MTAERRQPDPRHIAVRAAIAAAYAAANGGAACPWSGHAARRLSEALAAAPNWPLDRWQTCIEHRFGSENLPLSAAPANWVGSLADYASGPLDRYGRQRPALMSPSAAPPPPPPAQAELDAEFRRQCPPPPELPPGCRPLHRRERDAFDALILDVRRRVPPQVFAALWRTSQGATERGEIVICTHHAVSEPLAECVRNCAARAGIAVRLEAAGD